MNKKVYLGLDVGGRRIGVASGDSVARLASPLPTLTVNGEESGAIRRLVHDMGVTDVVIGRPRNQSGEPTEQTKEIERFVTATIEPLHIPVHWQDESLTSITAEQRLLERKKPYSKADIDAEAAAIILQDFLEAL
jgi:putative holliday junction resolvase